MRKHKRESCLEPTEERGKLIIWAGGIMGRPGGGVHHSLTSSLILSLLATVSILYSSASVSRTYRYATLDESAFGSKQHLKDLRCGHEGERQLAFVVPIEQEMSVRRHAKGRSTCMGVEWGLFV